MAAWLLLLVQDVVSAMLALPNSKPGLPSWKPRCGSRHTSSSIWRANFRTRTSPKPAPPASRAQMPAALPLHRVGSGVGGLMSFLVGTCGLGERRVEEVVEAVFEVPVAVGPVAKLEQEMSAALEPAHQQALAAVQEAPVKHLDETGWKKAGHKRWLWVAATSTLVVFLIHRLRNAAVVMQLLEQTLRRILCSDRWRAYDCVPLLQRQVCWAHLKRNFDKLVQRGGRAEKLGDEWP